MNNLKRIGLGCIVFLMLQDAIEYSPIFVKSIKYMLESDETTKNLLLERYYVYTQLSALFNISILALTFINILNWTGLKFRSYVAVCATLLSCYLLPRIYYSLKFDGPWFQFAFLIIGIVAMLAEINATYRKEHA